MPTTLKQIIYRIRNLARGGGISDDELVSYQNVKDWVQKYRSLLIARDLNKGHTISKNIEQDLGCVTLIEVDKAECCDLNSNCTILRTELLLPKPVELDYKDAITFVGSIEKQRSYELSSSNQSYFDTFNKYTGNVPKAYYLNGYIYITNETFLKHISVRGIFEDPQEAARFHTCSGEACYTDDSRYPISDKMIPIITDLILQKELNVVLKTTPDESNNANEA